MFPNDGPAAIAIVITVMETELSKIADEVQLLALLSLQSVCCKATSVHWPILLSFDMD